MQCLQPLGFRHRVGVRQLMMSQRAQPVVVTHFAPPQHDHTDHPAPRRREADFDA
jgi:hypothetical protein